MAETTCNISNASVKDIINITYPVGISIMCNHNPQTDWPWQTWMQDFQDRFALGAGSTHVAGETGGEETHTLSMNELPSHNFGSIPMIVPVTHANWNNGDIHASNLGDASSSKPGVTQNGNNMINGTQWSYEIDFPGGSQPHNNMPPYKAVAFWTRTA